MNTNKNNFALPKKNLILIAIGFAVIVIGFMLMVGGGSKDGVTFNPEIFSFRRITLASIVALIGFFFEIFAILWVPKNKKKDDKE